MKFCKDCKHVERQGDGTPAQYPRCLNPVFCAEEEEDLNYRVFGGVKMRAKEPSYCSTHRALSGDDLCGPQGRHWEANE